MVPERSNINVAILAKPNGPVTETGGAKAFTGALANKLDKLGFTVRVYGQRGATFPFRPRVRYVDTGLTAEEIVQESPIPVRRAIDETAVSPGLRVSEDIVRSLEKGGNERWVVLDNGIASVPLGPFLKNMGIPHIFVQHAQMTPNTYRLYQSLLERGGKLIAVSDNQREGVSSNYGPIHDITIKNGIETTELTPVPRPLLPGEEIQIGTLSRIVSGDSKGIGFAGMAVSRLNANGHPAMLSIAGLLQDRGLYDSIVAPLVDQGLAQYVGEQKGNNKSSYLSGLHVGAALSNPGLWNEQTRTFGTTVREGYSLTLGEMIYHGVVPVSTDSGGAEPLVDAGLSQFIVPLDVLQQEGMDNFVDLTAQTMLEAAAYSPQRRGEMQRRARTADQMGEEYAEYIMRLLANQ